MARLNNEFRLTGNMAAPMEKTFNPNNGKPIGRVRLGVDDSYTDRQTGELVERTVWHDLTFFNEKHIERLETYCGKGREIHVMGSLGKDVWDSKTRTNGDGSVAQDSRVTLRVSNLWLGREPRAKESAGAEGSESAHQAQTDADDDKPY